MPCAANGENSRNGLPGSISRPMRSRASNFPRATCLARASSLPPCIAASSLPRRSATRIFIAAALRVNSAEPGSMPDVSEVIAARSARLLEQLPADQHAPDFARARTDLVELGVAQISAGRIVVDVAIAAEELNGVERNLGGVLGSVEDGTSSILACRFATVARLGHGVDVGLARVHPDIHLGDLALHQLKLPNRLPKLPALVDVGGHHVHACLHDAERAGRQHYALLIEAGHQDRDAVADVAEDILLAHFAILKHQFTSVVAEQSDHVELLGRGKSLEVVLD